MKKEIKDFIAEMKKANTSAMAMEAVKKLLYAPSSDALINRLKDVATHPDINNETLGYYIFPGLRKKIADKDDEAIISKLQCLVRDPDTPADLSLHCIELIDRFLRKNSISYHADYTKFICETAVQQDIPKKVRTRLARLLTRVEPQAQTATLEQLIDTADHDFIEAACHTLSSWPVEKKEQYRQLIDKLISFVNSAPDSVIESVNILRTLAHYKQDQTRNALEAVVKTIKDPKNWLTLAACVGPQSSTKQLAMIIKKLVESPGLEAKMAHRTLLKNNPALVKLLFQEKYYREFVASLDANPSALGTVGLQYLEEIENTAGSTVRGEARSLRRELEHVNTNAIRTRHHILERRTSRLTSAAQPQNVRSTHAPFYTFIQMGDALYRNTHVIDPFCHNHWHAAIFHSFEFIHKGNDIQGHMLGIHMTGWPGAIVPFKAETQFSDAGADVYLQMQTLFNKFLVAFLVDEDHPFRGARHTPEMSKDDRLNLAKAAEDLLNRGIQYTFVDMLDWKGPNWSGAVSDIDNLRCDGVVEYVYESCGKKVCCGKKVANWNIANAGNQYPESHEDLHTWNLEDGELCPKVQAGEEGNDTTFIKPSPSGPILNHFSVLEESTSGGNVIALQFNLKSSQYHNLYVRIIVRKEGKSFRFIETELLGSQTGIAGSWMFRKADEGTDHRAYWFGKTLEGGSREDGKHEFRILAVDMGGNISEEQAVTLDIDWSRIQAPTE